MSARTAPGRLQQAAEWSVAIRGTGQSLERSTNLWSGGKFTVCGWCHLESYPAHTFPTLVSWEPSQFAYLGFRSNDNSLYLYDSALDQSTAFTRKFPAGSRLFWCITNDATAFSGYVAPAGAMALETISRAGITTAPSKLLIGNDDLDDYFSGKLWNVRLWDVVLTPGQIVREYLSPAPAHLVGLRGWYAADARSIGRDAAADTHLTVNGTVARAKAFMPRHWRWDRKMRYDPPAGGGGGSGGAATRAMYFGAGF